LDLNDIKSKEDIWKKNGGEVITMAPESRKRYVYIWRPWLRPSIAANRRSRTTIRLCSPTANKYK